MNKTNKTLGTLAIAFVPILLAFILDIITYFADLMLIVLIKSRSGETLSNSTSATDLLSSYMNSSFNQGLANMIKFILFLAVFGWWYLHSFVTTTNKDFRYFYEKPVSKLFKPVNIILFIISGYFIQLFVDSALQIMSTIFVKTFKEYSELISQMTGSGISILMIISVIILAPIAEEILFRGLTLRYALKIMPAWLAVFFQATLFGIYHGNLIQGIYAFVIGLLLGYIVYKTDSLIPAVILHASINISSYFIPSILISSNIKAALMLIISAALMVLIYDFIYHSYKRMLSHQDQ